MSDAAPHEIKPSGWVWDGVARLGLIVLVSTLIVDQVHKWWMINVYEIADKGRVAVTPFLDLVYVINKGISYGLLTQDGRGGQLLLAGFAATVAVGLTIWLIRGPHTIWAALGIGLVAGGALGNGIDRLHLGGVADFFSLHAYGFYWYVFNIADVAIVAGVVALLYDSVIASRKGAAN